MSRLEVLAPVRVVSFSASRPRPAPPSPVPASGASWGGAADFEFSPSPSPVDSEVVPDGDDGGGGVVTVSFVNKNRRVIGTERLRDAVVQQVALAGETVHVEGLRSATFFCGTRTIIHEDRVTSGSYTSVNGIREHRDEYVRFSFSSVDGAVVTRGEPVPPDTPPMHTWGFG